MKAFFLLVAMGALVCGCHTERNQGEANSENFSEIQTNNRGGSGMMQTNSYQGSGSSTLSNTNTPSSSQ